jgi:hypothetical protein
LVQIVRTCFVEALLQLDGPPRVQSDLEENAVVRSMDAEIPTTVLTGIGVGLNSSPLASAAAHDLPATRYASGGAFNSAVRQLGSVLGVALTFVLLRAIAKRGGEGFQARVRVDDRVRSDDASLCYRDRNET